MRLPCLLLTSVVDDMLQIFVKRLFCERQSEPVICDDVLVSSSFAFTPVTLFVGRIFCMRFKIKIT